MRDQRLPHSYGTINQLQADVVTRWLAYLAKPFHRKACPIGMMLYANNGALLKHGSDESQPGASRAYIDSSSVLLE
jgi:hypothetical protein